MTRKSEVSAISSHGERGLKKAGLRFYASIATALLLLSGAPSGSFAANTSATAGQAAVERVNIDGIEVSKKWADDIPVIYIEPENAASPKRLAIFLSGLGGRKEALAPYLKDIADKGYIALAFDNYRHGERGTESRDEIHARVFSNLRHHGWVILGQTVLDTSRVIDWAIRDLGVEPSVRIGGISLGGDISIAVAGVDPRIARIAPIVATPDWLRPGIHKLTEPEQPLDTGSPDSYAQFFYDQFNPITHLGRYVDTPPGRWVLGRDDNHIPPENAERFKAELAKLSPQAAERIEFIYVEGPNANHRDAIGRKAEWWPGLLDWWLAD